MIKEIKKKDTISLNKTEKKQMNSFMNDWWKMQQMETNKGFRNNKSYKSKRKSLKLRAKKIDDIIKKYNNKTKKQAS